MVCKHCGGNQFTAHQRVYMDIVVDGNNLFEEQMPGGIYESETPYGPYQCCGCGAEYEDLTGAEISGPVKNWTFRRPAFEKAFEKVFGPDDKLGERLFQRWEGENYKVKLTFYKSGFIFIQVVTKAEGFPDIFVNGVDEPDAPVSVQICGAGSGSINLEDFAGVLSRLDQVKWDAEQILRCFATPLSNGTFDKKSTAVGVCRS